MTNLQNQRIILTVSELTAQIKKRLEKDFPFVWVTGEISNFRVPVSGHFYFTLKDAQAQIGAVMFRGQNSVLKFDPEDGMQISGLGRISVYEPRGNYQIIFEYMEPSGVGALQVAFEQLKEKLAAEGLFDQKLKKPVPFLPTKISIITSPTGAVVHDILRILNRRYPNLDIEIVPAKVQGVEAEKELIAAIELLNTRKNTEIAILARGGGSLEDLQAFNSEALVRAVFDSEIPIISAVGHETDYTLTDFVADLRMPTPSAAAEIVIPIKTDLKANCLDFQRKLISTLSSYTRWHRSHLNDVIKQLVDPRKKVQDFRLRIDDVTSRLVRGFMQDFRVRKERTNWRTEKLLLSNPSAEIDKLNNELDNLNYKLSLFINNLIMKRSLVLQDKLSKLQALSPLEILKRGYSITRTIPEAEIVRDSRDVQTGQKLDILLGSGVLDVTITSCTHGHRFQPIAEPEKNTKA